jgi:tRNA(adenine34) deaminase
MPAIPNGDTDADLMRMALQEAREAGLSGEVPIGAVVALDGKTQGRGRNSPISLNDPTGHAEILAIRDAANRIGNYRLTGATLVSTVEPCLMCLGAALHARIGRIVFGAADPKVGATDILARMEREGALLNHRFQVTGGILAEEASNLILEFFQNRRAGEAAGDDDVVD